MHKLKFGKFQDGKYPESWDVGPELYIIKNGRKLLYIGITSQGIWNRWFGDFGHIVNFYGEMSYTSGIGRMVLENMPKSRNWIIELWTVGDCVKFLGLKSSPYIDAKYVEGLMIAKLRPPANGRA